MKAASEHKGDYATLMGRGIHKGLATFAKFDMLTEEQINEIVTTKLDDCNRQLRSLTHKVKKYPYKEFAKQYGPGVSIVQLITDGPYYFNMAKFIEQYEKELYNRRTIPNALSWELFPEAEDFEPKRHKFFTMKIHSKYNLHADFSRESFMENLLIDMLNFKNSIRIDASLLLLDSYMLDVDELQLGAFRFIGSR